MPIVVSCPCGEQLRARDEWAGMQAQCPGCGRLLSVPAKRVAAPKAGGMRRFFYLLLLLAMIPLGWQLHHARETDRELKGRIERTFAAHPEARIKLPEEPQPKDYDNALAELRGHRIEGAFLARDTRWHWAF